MKQQIEEMVQKNKEMERKAKVLGADSIVDLVEVRSEVMAFQQEIEHSQLKKTTSQMEKNNKKLSKEIDIQTKLIAALNECLSGRVNVSEIRQTAAKRHLQLEEMKNKQTKAENAIQEIMRKIKILEQDQQ